MNDRRGFRDDQQAGRALDAVLAPVPFRDLWSEHGPTARARVFLDRDTCGTALSASDRFRLFSADTLWLCHKRGRLLRWPELLEGFRRWDRSGDPPPVQVDGRTAGDVRELVSAVQRGPAAVDGWLVAYASSAAPHECDPESLIAVLALVDSRQRKGEPYPGSATWPAGRA